MGRADYYLSGAWNFICDQCGEKWKSVDAMKQWDGLIVCPICWEPRNPQDFIKAIPEKPIPWSRPDQQPCVAPTPPGVSPRFLNDPDPLDTTWLG